MKKLPLSVIATNVFGSVGYLLLLFNWVLLLSFIMLAIITIQTPSPQETSSILFMRHLQTPEFVVGIGYLVAIIGAIITIGVFVALPYLIGMWSSRVVRYILRMVKVPLTARTLFFAKCCVGIVPLFVFLLYQVTMQPEMMFFAVLYVTTLIVTIIALLCFVAQLFLGRYLRIPLKRVW